MRLVSLTLALTLCLALLASPCLAAALQPDDFAFGLNLKLDGDAAFYELELPFSVYAAVTKDDLADLRVFNHNGEIVPHQLRPQLPNQLSAAVEIRPLPFFPLPATDDGNTDNLALRVVRNREGTIVDVHSDGHAVDAHSSGWLVDLGKTSQGALELGLRWAPESESHFGTVRIDSSADLVHWTPLITTAVASLTFQGQHLERNSVKLPHPDGRYLRLTWPDDLSALRLTAIELRVATHQRQPQQLKHLTLHAADSAGSRFDYQLPGPLPVEELHVQLPETNQIAECTLASSANGKEKWHNQWRGLIYRLGHDSQQIDSGLIRINRTRHRFWRLVCTANEAGLSSPPAIDFGWRPDRLLFLARGEPPFLLAVGSQKALQARFAVDLLDRQKINPGRATVTGEQTLGGSSRLKPPLLPWPGKQLVLWALLCGGVILICVLALSLHRQLRNGDKPDAGNDH